MLAIKLQIIGKKHAKSFRLIVQERRAKLDGKSVEDIGWYSSHTDKFEINKERALYWLGVGAQPTDTAGQLLKKAGVQIVRK